MNSIHHLTSSPSTQQHCTCNPPPTVHTHVHTHTPTHHVHQRHPPLPLRHPRRNRRQHPQPPPHAPLPRPLPAPLRQNSLPNHPRLQSRHPMARRPSPPHHPPARLLLPEPSPLARREQRRRGLPPPHVHDARSWGADSDHDSGRAVSARHFGTEAECFASGCGDVEWDCRREGVVLVREA
ncbi:hypothetical protein EJ03DRAFT_170525 [Teratosphaeria nubilosa]|uniref:Uncharacterized protein n=1 Tax=Teratosphaeria nubilosa TaxID=161662 RepID=A0A6G1LJK7_9PEZI|nr:hypothetical protein EJ03DRAFT_170525 [Teratosphaeria nubilosa]